MTYDRSAWASRKAAELRRQADALPEPAAGDWRARKAHRELLAHLRAEAVRFDGIAARGPRRVA